jgi:cysteine desulfurase
LIYLDNASGIELLDEVKNNIIKNLEYCYNSSSSHSIGQKASSKIQKTRELIASIFNANPNNVIFTSGATESNNLAIKGYQKKRESVYALAFLGFEHNSVTNPLKELKKEGYNLVKLKYNDIINNLEEVINTLKINKVSFLALCDVYPNIGIKLPIKKIVKRIKEDIPRIHIHVDMAQSFMKTDTKMINIDSISISGHKIGALQGVGALILRDKQIISPIITGGKQNSSLRAGTENILGILSLYDAISVWINNKEVFNNKLLSLNNYIRSEYEKTFHDNNNLKILTPNVNYCNNIIVIAIRNVLSEHIIRFLDENNNIIISPASTCGNLNFKPPFLSFIELEKEFHNGIIRISISPFSKKSEIDMFFQKFKEAILYFF